METQPVIRKTVILILLAVGVTWAEGPKYGGYDKNTALEFENVYQDIRSRGTADPLTIGAITVSTLTVTTYLKDANLSPGTSGYVYTSRGTSLAPQWLPQVSTPSITAWASWTPTFTNFGTVSGVSAWWRRVGDTIEVRGTTVSGTTSGATGKMSLPNGFTIDTSKAGSQAVLGDFIGAGTGSVWWSANFVAVLFYDGSDNTALFMAKTNSGSSLTKQNANNICNSNEIFSFRFTFPATGLGVQ